MIQTRFMKEQYPNQLAENQLEISEIFHSLQGEGPLMGRPATFIRLSGCLPPLCPWCDTIHAHKSGQKISIEDIVAKCVAFDKKLVVVTGGEPFLQWATGLQHLEMALLERGFEPQYETSGKVTIPLETHGFVVCSPKYLHDKWHFKEENLARIDAFKFVVDESYEEINAFITLHTIPNEVIWIMAQGSDRDTQLTKTARIWEYCVEKKYNFSPRLHVLAFNERKGV